MVLKAGWGHGRAGRSHHGLRPLCAKRRRTSKSQRKLYRRQLAGSGVRIAALASLQFGEKDDAVGDLGTGEDGPILRILGVDPHRLVISSFRKALHLSSFSSHHGGSTSTGLHCGNTTASCDYLSSDYFSS